MPFNVTMHPGRYLLVVGTGDARIADYVHAISAAAELARRERTTRVLLDLLSVEPNLSPDEHSMVGRHAGEAFRDIEKVACVVDKRFRTGVGEKAAQAIGKQLRTFTKLSEAEEWLMT